MIFKLRQKCYFVIVFILLVFLTHTYLHYEKDAVIDEYLAAKTEKMLLEYHVIYNKYKDMANLVYRLEVNTPEVIKIFKARDRQALREHFEIDYKQLRTFSIRQLHFHLPNNDSFLRMHRPEKFGDNLSNDRATVKYVNKYLKPVDGFEEGKIFNGFRFVYPLFDNKEHIGSVEISFSALAFIKEMMKHFDVKSNFHIDKKVVNEKVFEDEKSNYIQSRLPQYYSQKSIVEYLDIDMKQNHISKEETSLIYEKIQEGKSFSQYFKADKMVITFIPIKSFLNDKIVSVLTFRSDDAWIVDTNKNAQKIFAASFMFLTLIVFLLYQEFKSKIYLEDMVEKRTRELKKEKNRLRYQANHDPLTDLKNRLSMNADIQSVIQNYSVHKAPYAILMFDIDWFKSVNDLYGHEVGDKVLVELSKLFKKSVREEDRIYRAGGEEFVIILKRITYKDSVKLAQKIRLLVQEHIFRVDNEEFSKTISGGLYHSSLGDIQNVKSVLKLVDHALYESKTNGRNRVTVATSDAEFENEELITPTIKIIFSDATLSRVLAIDTQNIIVDDFDRVKLLTNDKEFKESVYKEDQLLLDSIEEKLKNNQLYTTTLRVINKDTQQVVLYKIEISKEGENIVAVLQKSVDIAKGVSDSTLIQNLQSMLENTNDYIYFKDRNHVFTAASKTLASITSVDTRAELVGKVDYDVFEKDLADEYFILERKVFDSELEVAQEFQPTLDNDGNKAWVDNRKYPIHNELGEIIGLFGIARVISDDEYEKQNLS